MAFKSQSRNQMRKRPDAKAPGLFHSVVWGCTGVGTEPDRSGMSRDEPGHRETRASIEGARAYDQQARAGRVARVSNENRSVSGQVGTEPSGGRRRSSSGFVGRCLTRTRLIAVFVRGHAAERDHRVGGADGHAGNTDKAIRPATRCTAAALLRRQTREDSKRHRTLQAANAAQKGTSLGRDASPHNC